MKKVLPVLLLLAACTEQPQVEEEVLTEDVIDTTNVEVTAPEEEDLMTRLDGFFEHLKESYDVADEGSCSIIDENTITCEAYFRKKEDLDGSGIYPEFSVVLYDFADGQKANEKIVQFLSSFENSGEDIVVGTNIEAIKSPPMHILLCDNEAVVIQYPCEHMANDWEPLINELVEHFGKDSYWLGSMFECGINFKWTQVQ